MLTKKSVLLGLALLFLLMPGLVMAGEEQGTALDFEIDISQLGTPCKYWAAGPPNGDVPGQPRLHSGRHTEVRVSDVGTVALQLACTDQPLCEQTGAGLNCFVAGEHYIRLETNSPMAGCVWFTLKGLRGAATSIRIEGVKQPFRYLSIKTDGVNMVCGLQANQVLEMRMMMCPDVSGNHALTDFWQDVMGTLRLNGTEEGQPGWDFRFDHNEDGIITLFGDIFAVINRWGLHCDDFDY